MLIDRRELLRALEGVAIGLNTKANLEQSNCFCFQSGKVCAFNEEVYTIQDTDLDICGAVPSKPLLETLRKLTEDELTITATDTELRIKGQGRRSAVRLNPQVLLPTGQVEAAESWTELAPAFGDALPLVASCAADENQIFELTCVRVSAKGLEACDQRQAIRYAVPTGITGEVLLRGTSCKLFNGLGIAEIAETPAWLWFKTYTGLQAAIRKISGKYPPLGDIFKTPKIAEIDLPGSVVDILARAAVFQQETATGKLVNLSLKEGKMMVRASNTLGFFEEIKAVDYSGPALTLGLNPKYLEALVKHGLPIAVTAESIRITGESFIYALALEAGN